MQIALTRATLVIGLLFTTAGALDQGPDEQVMRTARDSVVRVTCGAGHGSGFLFGSRDRAATAFHVVQCGGPVRVIFRDGGSTEATVVAYDRERDLALLQLGRPGPGRPLERDRQVEPRLGDAVFAIGHPMFQDDPAPIGRGLLQWTVTSGIVSGLTADVAQTDAAVNPGNSGGPLLSRDGRLLGVVVQKWGEGLGFAMRAHLLDGLVTNVGRQEPFRGEWDFMLSAGGGLGYQRGQEGPFIGFTVGVGWIMRERYAIELRFWRLRAENVDAVSGEGVFERSVERIAFESALAYHMVLGRKRRQVIIGAGAALSRDKVDETKLEIELQDPTCDIAMRPCETMTTAKTSELVGDWAVRPMLAISNQSSRLGVSLATYADLDSPRESELRITLSLIY
jgi:hypothetical protein